MNSIFNAQIQDSSTHSIEKWISAALGPLGTVKLDYNLCKPHRLFRYPDFPLLEKSQSDNIEVFLKQLIFKADPNRVRLGPTFEILLSLFFENFAENRKKQSLKVASIHPHLPEFLTILEKTNFIQVIEIPRDPEKWESFFSIDNEIDLFLISHPNFADGYAWPQSFFSKLLMTAEKSHPNAAILIDPRNTLFSLDSVPAGRIEPILQAGQLQNIPVYIIDSIFPIRSPTGPGTSWILPFNSCATEKPEWLKLSSEVSTADLIQTSRALLAFMSRQGPAMAEFQRRILVLQRSVRAFADKLMPLARPPHARLHIPYWPTQGFMLKIDLVLDSSDKKINVSQPLVLEMVRNFSLLAIPGEVFGCPQSFFINYALPLNHAEKAANRLSEALLAVL